MATETDTGNPASAGFRIDQTPAAIDVSVVIVSFNTVGVLRQCLASVCAQVGVRLETTVVDNASADGSAEMVCAEYPHVRLIRNGSNRGFAAACNQGFAEGRGRFVLLLNPDAAAPASSIAAMMAFLDAHPRVGICGPRLLLGDGSLQSCGRSFPTLASVLRQSRSIERLAVRLGVGQAGSPLPDAASPCDWVEGACLMIRRETIAEIGPLDERFFLFAEEMDWCYSAHEHRWDVYALPDVAVTHLRGVSTRQRESESLPLLVQMTLTYFQKRRGVAVAALVGAIWMAGFLKQAFGDRREAGAKLRGVGRWVASVRSWY